MTVMLLSDLVTTYDHFASGVLMEYEAAGFCEVGDVRGLAERLRVLLCSLQPPVLPSLRQQLAMSP